MEKEEKVQVHIHEGVNTNQPIEIVLRQGEASQPIESLPLKEPQRISIIGVITTPADWLDKRVGTIDPLRANVRVNREKMTIELTINEDDYYAKNTISGTVRLSETFEKLGINDEKKAWEPARLGQFLRINRAIFEDKEQAMLLVAGLKNFTAKAKSEIQKQRDPSGSTADVFKQQVESNLPKSFTANIALFAGAEKHRIEVEFDHFVRDGEVYLQLVSPGASEIVSEFRDTVIDSVLDRIRATAPDIAILEI